MTVIIQKDRNKVIIYCKNKNLITDAEYMPVKVIATISKKIAEMLHENDFKVTKAAGLVSHRRRYGFPYN